MRCQYCQYDQGRVRRQTCPECGKWTVTPLALSNRPRVRALSHESLAWLRVLLVASVGLSAITTVTTLARGTAEQTLQAVGGLVAGAAVLLIIVPRWRKRLPTTRRAANCLAVGALALFIAEAVLLAGL